MANGTNMMPLSPLAVDIPGKYNHSPAVWVHVSGAVGNAFEFNTGRRSSQK
jgi:hypothetical protein